MSRWVILLSNSTLIRAAVAKNFALIQIVLSYRSRQPMPALLGFDDCFVCVACDWNAEGRIEKTNANPVSRLGLYLRVPVQAIAHNIDRICRR